MNYSAAEIRRSFLNFFAGHDHKVMPSSPVIPYDDPTLLFTNAGMNQFKKIFTGEERAPAPRAATVQKCMRAGGKHNDLENVGFTSRHHTFFEMLGNFSFGDYFKEQAIVYAWDLLTREYKLEPSRLWATVYDDDDEAFALWEKVAPELKKGKRILRFGKKDNFWSMGDVGPCGPCSEIHFDRGDKFGAAGGDNVVNGDGERFMEIWNLVFMQFEQKPDGAVVNLPKGSVDTGAGLERMAVALQGVESNYDIDLFRNIISAIEQATHTKYSRDSKGASHRVIADHLRALCFCIADGAGISNEKQGYVLRRILRRAARHGRQLGVEEPFIYKLVPALVGEMGDVYPELKEKQEHVTKVIRAEEESFGRTLDTGLTLFEKEVGDLSKSGKKVIPGSVVFSLYDTHGFPVDLTEVMARERGMTIDMAGYEHEMELQRERARAATAFTGNMVARYLDKIKESNLRTVDETEFVRGTFSTNSVILTGGYSPFPEYAVVLDKTPFYAESGGQIGDIGRIYNEFMEIRVDSVLNHNGYIIHSGKLVRGNRDDYSQSMEVIAEVADSRRMSIMRNHTATHLMHKALRMTLGDHVRQAGSLVSDEKLRFDFSHFQQMTDTEVSRVENIVNDEILRATPVTTDIMALEDAKKTGAMALFGEKYADKVRVVSIGDFSKELCGGTHVTNTSEIGPFMITMEGGVSSGVRRIEAITGHAAIERMLSDKRLTDTLTRELKVSHEQITDATLRLLEETNSQRKEIKKLKSEKFSGGGESVGESTKVGDVTLYTHNFGEVDKDEITGWADGFKTQTSPAVAAGIGATNGKSVFISSASPSAIQRGVHIGNAARKLFEQYGSRGGGKDNFAQGSAPEGVSDSELFSAYKRIIAEALTK